MCLLQATTEKREQNKRVLSKNRSSWLGVREQLFLKGWVPVYKYSLPKNNSSQARSASSARSMPLRGSAAPLLEPQNERRVERTVEAVL